MKISVEVEFDEQEYEDLEFMAEYFEDTSDISEMIKEIVESQLEAFHDFLENRGETQEEEENE